MSQTVDLPATTLLHTALPAARWLVDRFYGVRRWSPERIPADGAVILAANHIGILDGPLLVATSPRPVHALTKQEMYAGPAGPLLHASGQIKLDRFHPDPGAVKACLRVLADGGVVGIFPEGTRGGGELSRFHPGAAYLALVSGAPVVPVTLLGTRLAGQPRGAFPPRGGPIDIVYGERWQVPGTPWPRRKAEVAEASHALQAHMKLWLADALERTGRELPGEPPPPVVEEPPPVVEEPPQAASRNHPPPPVVAPPPVVEEPPQAASRNHPPNPVVEPPPVVEEPPQAASRNHPPNPVVAPVETPEGES